MQAPVDALPITIDEESLRKFCTSNNVEELALFGSVLRDDFTDKSDIDVVIKFTDGSRVSLLTLCHYEIDLAEILDAKNKQRKVDLTTPKSINPKLKDKILNGRLILYVRAS